MWNLLHRRVYSFFLVLAYMVVTNGLFLLGQGDSLVVTASYAASYKGRVEKNDTAQSAPKKKTFPRLEEQGVVILNRLKQANGVPMEQLTLFKMLDSEELNAATDGKGIYFSRGLWNALGNEDQRAFVIGHELSHVVLNHVQKTQYRRVGLLGLNALLSKVWSSKRESKTQKFLQLAQNAGIAMVDMRFSRRAEYEADDVGVGFMVNAGYRPEGALEAFRVLEKANTSSTPEFLRSHPLSRSRIEMLVRKYQLR